MLSKKYRLSIKERLKKPQFLNLEFFKIIKGENALSYLRFAVVVSKKISKKAVIRNRIKRIIYGILEKEKLENKKTQDLVIILKPNILEKDRKNLVSEIKKIF